MAWATAKVRPSLSQYRKAQHVIFSRPLFCSLNSRAMRFHWFIFFVSVLSIGHSFGTIPAPGSFASSAFEVPPNKSSETPSKISCVPPKKQPLALGAVSTRFRVPQLQGQKQEKKHARKRSPSNRLSRQKPGAQVRQGVRPQIRGSFAGDSAVLEGCRRRMALQDGVASRRRLERPRRVRSDEAAEKLTSSSRANS